MRHRPSAVHTMDVVAVGGGPAGIATTLRLRQHGHCVALIERGRFERTRVGEVVPPEIRKPLTELALWRRFEALKLRPVSGIDLRWGSKKLRRHDHFLSPYQQAWVLPKSRFDWLLADTAAARGVVIHPGSIVRQIKRGALVWRLDLSGPQGADSIYCRYLVDATGRQNAFSKMIGRHAVRFDALVGIAGVQPVDAESDNDSLMVESDVDGWRYSVTLRRGRSACVYMTDADIIPRGDTTRAGWWRERMGGLILEPNGLVSEPDCPPQVMPAQTVLTRPIAGDDFLSVGDSANALDPLSGMGVLRALSGGILGADALHATLEGAKSALNEYAANVERDFSRQLAQRATFYNEERRWPQSSFWIRRQQKQLANISVELDPTTKLLRKPGTSSTAMVAYLTIQYAGSVFDAIWKSSERPVTAVDLASHVRIELGDRVSDRDIITGMQAMLAAGVLTVRN